MPKDALLERGVYRRLLEEGYRFQFSQAVRLLEIAFPDAPAVGTTANDLDGRIRLRPSTELVFPSTDLSSVHPSDDGEAVEILNTFFGLYGINSPLPYHFYEPLTLRQRGTRAHRHFLDLFNHRFLSFFYRAWKKYRPGIGMRSKESDGHSRRFLSLAGLGTPQAAEDVQPSPMRLAAKAGILGSQVRNAEGLEVLLQTFYEDLEVEVVENVPRWVPRPSNTGLGDDGFELGGEAVIGEQIYDRSGKFRLRLGPLDIDRYLEFLPGGDEAEFLDELVRLYAPDHLAYDIELNLPADALPTMQLGESGSQLGYTTSLGTPEEETVSRVVEYE